ncbi:MAG: GNAT family N-acetyltransferase [Deltaproteobacteria bacterium]|nr:MAG: GNAT family N-acetyltransferase [Deltaproteobacteria bacterium]
MSVAVKLREEELRVEVLPGRDAFCSLEREWNAALAKGPRDEPMLRHEWTRAFIENFAPGATLRTFVARAGRELHAALPLIESRDRAADTCFLPMTTWAMPSNDHSQRGGMLLGRRSEEGLRAIWEQLMDTPGWDRLRLRDLPDGAQEWQLRGLAERAGYPCGLFVSMRSPYLPLPKKYEEVEAAVDGKFRQNLRRRKRRLAEQGEVKYVIVDGRDAKELDEALADFFTIEAGGWKGQSGTAIAQRPDLVGFYTQVARDAAKRKELMLGFLELANKRIAGHMSLIRGARSYLFKLGYDEKFHEFSPGQQLVSEAIRDACSRGLAEFDFLGPCMDWKLDWESKLRTHSWLTIFRPTQKGLWVHEARYTIWPIVRRFFRRGN